MECELCDHRIATLEVSDGAYSFCVCSRCSDALGDTWLVMAEADRRG